MLPCNMCIFALIARTFSGNSLKLTLHCIAKITNLKQDFSF